MNRDELKRHLRSLIDRYAAARVRLCNATTVEAMTQNPGAALDATATALEEVQKNNASIDEAIAAL